MPDETPVVSRRKALKCMAYGGAGTLFGPHGGILDRSLQLAVEPGNDRRRGRLRRQ